MVQCIARLRSKGAPYHGIARILDTVKIRVSLDTLSRFCREPIEQNLERKCHRSFGTAPVSKPAATPLSKTAMPHAATDSPVLAKHANATEPTVPPRGKGPRIADSTNI